MQVPASHITRLDIIPDIDRSQVNITVHGSAAARNRPVQVLLTDKDGKEVSIFLCISTTVY